MVPSATVNDELAEKGDEEPRVVVLVGECHHRTSRMVLVLTPSDILGRTAPIVRGSLRFRPQLTVEMKERRGYSDDNTSWEDYISFNKGLLIVLRLGTTNGGRSRC